jgi:hypothetical protein
MNEGVELSVAGPKLRGSTSLPSRVGDASDEDGRLAALNCTPRRFAIGICPICFEFRRLVRDHDWDTGMVRNRICERCNGNLGAIENHPAWNRTTLGRRWWKWFFDHSERIARHMETTTSERYKVRVLPDRGKR